jgi:hypothetical protein
VVDLAGQLLLLAILRDSLTAPFLALFNQETFASRGLERNDHAIAGHDANLARLIGATAQFAGIQRNVLCLLGRGISAGDPALAIIAISRQPGGGGIKFSYPRGILWRANIVARPVPVFAKLAVRMVD